MMTPAAVAPTEAVPNAASPGATAPNAATAPGVELGSSPATLQNATGPCTGVIKSPANGMTVVSVQGFKFGKNGGKRPAKLVGVGPRGNVEWVHHSAAKYDVVWGYDVDPMANGNVFVTATVKGHKTLVYELNPRTQERVWSKTFDVADTHDADLINNGTAIAVANMRNYHPSNRTNDDRVFVYNRTTQNITWQWRFDDHYDPKNLEENYTHDWTHLNDVDKVGEDRFLLSPRNFDQAIVVDRSSNEIVMKLGEDGKKNILNEQHNPDFLRSENGTPTILVADSENGRIVEYANPDGVSGSEASGGSSDSSDGDLKNGQGWNRVWTLKGDLKWPRDADRLPNGNTLVSDSSHNRVVEVTPKGDIVWEFYAPWLVYDAARVTDPNESGGPTMRDINASGTYKVGSGAGLHKNDSKLTACHAALQNASGRVGGQGLTANETEEGAIQDEESETTDASDTTAHGDSGASIPGFGVPAALAALVAAALLARRD